MVQTTAEDARPSATEATAAVQTERKKRRPGGTCLRRVDIISRDLSEIPEWHGYPPAQVNPILICDGVQQLDPAQRP